MYEYVAASDPPGGAPPTPAEARDDLEAMPPSAELMAELARRAGSAMDRDEQLSLIAAAERCIAWLHALQLQVIGSADQGVGPRVLGVEDVVREELQCLLRFSPGVAAGRLQLARDLRDRLPGMAEVLRSGLASEWHARVLAEETASLDTAGCIAVEDRVLAKATEVTAQRFRAVVHRAVLAVDPTTAEERRVRAARDRRVEKVPMPDGMGALWSLLPADDLATCWSVIDTWARSTLAEDDRTLDQRRVDALVEICRRALSDQPGVHRPAGAGTDHGVPVTIQVTVSLDTLRGREQLPAELHGYGPITAGLASSIAGWGGARFRRLVLDGTTGRLVAVDPTCYGSLGELVRHAGDPALPP